MTYRQLIAEMSSEQRRNARLRIERLGGRVVTAEELLATLLGRRQPAPAGAVERTKSVYELRPDGAGASAET